MRVLVTGSQGFIGKNLIIRLTELPGYEVIRFERGDDISSLKSLLLNVDAIVHLAGENRPSDVSAFTENNFYLTKAICEAVTDSCRSIPLILASSTQADQDNPYGRSKRLAENAVEELAESGNPAVIYRLPGVFGKWCKPNYNSVVATFCHNIANDLPIQISDSSTSLNLVYVDDVISSMLTALLSGKSGLTKGVVAPEYKITLGDLAEQIYSFHESRTSLITERVGVGLIRALYATYISYLPKEKFSYLVKQYEDQRGVFVEMLKTPDSGQFSYFTAHPGITRGGHYHHTKTEKFLVIKGEALFRFRNLITNESYQLRTSGKRSIVVDTIPGWTHDVTNVGEDEMVVLLWANENFDRESPDTVISKV